MDQSSGNFRRKIAVWLGASDPRESPLLAGGDAGMVWFVTGGKRRPLPSLQTVRLKLNQREPGLGENFLTTLQGQSAWPASLGSYLGCANEKVCLRNAKCLAMLLTIAL